MKILLIGSGGREHAIAWKLAQSARVSEIVARPGNAGIGAIARLAPGPIDPQSLLALAHREQPDLVVIGPEAPLVAGAADTLSGHGYRVFGPGRAAARLEGSKSFAKEFMRRHRIATARFETFSDEEEALAHIHRVGAPVVVKDSRLAAGKGVTVAVDEAEAEEAVRRVFSSHGGNGLGAVGNAQSSGAAESGPQVVIEERLEGQEISYLVFCDGASFAPMPLAQDYKQAREGDEGPMTGGMGTVAPVDLLDESQQVAVRREIVERTLAGLRVEGIDYRGVLYFGLMITPTGPKLLEYNVRFGDPETQVVLPLLETDLVELCEAVIDGRLATSRPRWRGGAAACVVLAAPGYPGDYPRGLELSRAQRLMTEVSRREPGDFPGGESYRDTQRGLAEEREEETVAYGGAAAGGGATAAYVFHAGTAWRDDKLISDGGRVLNVVATAATIEEAVSGAYRAVEDVDFERAHYRKDIGSRLR